MSHMTIYTSMVLGPCITYLHLDHKQTMNLHKNLQLIHAKNYNQNVPLDFNSDGHLKV